MAIETQRSRLKVQTDTEQQGKELRLLLPSTWFAGHADPVQDHPLSVRYLRDVRLRNPWPIPAVKVIADDDLEPGSFVVQDSQGDVVT